MFHLRCYLSISALSLLCIQSALADMPEEIKTTTLPTPEGFPFSILFQLKVDLPMTSQLDQFGKAIPSGEYTSDTW